jgi:hypothetical protein
VAITLEFDGLDELRRQLRDLPKALEHEAQPIVRAATERTAAAMTAGYPARAGAVSGKARNARVPLKNSVRTTYPAPLVGIAYSNSDLSHIYEKGTKARSSKRGNRGVMPAHPITGAAAHKNREQMLRELIAMVERHGFDVQGE